MSTTINKWPKLKIPQGMGVPADAWQNGSKPKDNVMHTEALVSIVLPVYNGSKYLHRAIDSCLKQTYQYIELIIVDDCSYDNTPEIVHSYSDPRIKYIRNEKNRGLPRSLNIGFAHAQGDFLTWTSDDNEYLPCAIEEMYTFLKKNTHVDFVYTDVMVKDLETGKENLKKLGELRLEDINNMGACYLYTRKLYEKIGDYDTRFEWVEDYDYWIRISKKFQIRYLPKALYIYGHHPRSLTSLRYYPIAVIQRLLRYYHGYVSFDDLVEGYRDISVKISQEVKSPTDRFEVWQQIIRKSLRMPPHLGFLSLSLYPYLVVRKIYRFLYKLCFYVFKKSFEHISFLLLFSSLKFDPHKQNILCIVPQMVVGGSEKVMQDIVCGLENQHYDFHLLCAQKQDNPWCRNFASSFKNVIQIKDIEDPHFYYGYLSEAIHRLDIKVVLLTNAMLAYQCLPRLKSEFPDLKVVDILHLELVGGTREKYAWVAPYLDKRICISAHVRDFMKDLYARAPLNNQLKDKLKVIYNGIDAQRFDPERLVKGKFYQKYQLPLHTKIIAFIGRMTLEKKPFLFFDVCRELLRAYPHESLKFVMAGDGPYLEKIKIQIKDAGLEEHFILLGMVADVTELLADTYLLLSVSQHEGIPLVLQEAMIMGVPVLSTNVGGIRELVKEDINGYLVSLDENAIDQFVFKIGKVLNDPELYKKLCQNARQTIFPQFTLDYMSSCYKQELKELLLCP